MRVTIEIRSNRLTRLAERLHARAAEEVAAAAIGCQSIAKVLVPKDTGALARSIVAEPESPLSWVVGTNVEYAPFVEYGTYRTPAQPYLTPAAEQVRQPFIDNLRAAVEDIAK